MADGYFFVYADLSTAISTLTRSLEIDLTKYDEFETDVLKNGQIQK